MLIRFKAQPYPSSCVCEIFVNNWERDIQSKEGCMNKISTYIEDVRVKLHVGYYIEMLGELILRISPTYF